jgi:Probable lipoprotein LpqN
VRRVAAAVAIAAATVSAAGCGPKTPDYQSVLGKTSTTTTSTTEPTKKPVPLSQYLNDIGVSGQQVASDAVPEFKVSIPTPAGWTAFNDPKKVAPQTVLISKGGKYPTARLVVFRLRGDFDPAQVIKHGNDDAQLFDNFRQLDTSMSPFNGFPSSMIQGSYDLDGIRLHSFNRIVLPTGPPPGNQHYLIQLTITSLADQAAAESNDIEAIIHGFVVAPK